MYWEGADLVLERDQLYRPESEGRSPYLKARSYQSPLGYPGHTFVGHECRDIGKGRHFKGLKLKYIQQ